jgi:hypothetical protein
LAAEPVRVRYSEGVTHGFLVLRDLSGQVLANGELSQVVSGKDGVVTDDLHFRFKDGSSYQEITKFTQHGEFRLISNKVVQKGPAFKQDSEAEIDIPSGKITVTTTEGGKEKVVAKHLDMPPDVANGLLPILTKNLDAHATHLTVSAVAATTTPRVVKLVIFPAGQKKVSSGLISHEVQDFLVKVKIGGLVGIIAPIIGKQPPDTHIWIERGEAPSFLKSEGPLSTDTPAWRIELTAPDLKSLGTTQ